MKIVARFLKQQEYINVRNQIPTGRKETQKG